jgi:hypothetical protein
VSCACGPYIKVFQYFQLVISNDAIILSGRYERRLSITYGYDVENQLVPLTFALVDMSFYQQTYTIIIQSIITIIIQIKFKLSLLSNNQSFRFFNLNNLQSIIIIIQPI